MHEHWMKTTLHFLDQDKCHHMRLALEELVEGLRLRLRLERLGELLGGVLAGLNASSSDDEGGLEIKHQFKLQRLSYRLVFRDRFSGTSFTTPVMVLPEILVLEQRSVNVCNGIRTNFLDIVLKKHLLAFLIKLSKFGIFTE